MGAHSRRNRRFDSSWTLPCLVVLGAIVIANIVYLAGVFNPDPLGQYANLTTHLQRGLLPGQDNIDPNLGFTSQALGHLAALDWLHGKVPWWNPFEGLGMPLAGEMQSAALFPLVIFDALPHGLLYFHVVLEAVAGLSMLFLLRRLVSSRWAATAGAVVFALNGTFAWMFHAAGNPVAFAPMSILGIEQARSPSGRRFAGWPLIAVAGALSVYAGFPETAYIDGLLALLWAAVRASELRGRDLLGFVRRLGTGAGVGVLLAAPILVAFADFSRHADLLHHSGSGYANLYMVASQTLPAVAMPYIYGPIFGWLRLGNGATIGFWSNIGGYLDASLLVLGLVGLAGKPERRLRLALGAWLVLAIGRTVGASGLLQAVNAVPGIKLTAFYRYSEPSWTLALCVLAVLAIDDLARHPYRVRMAIAAVLSLAAVWYLAVQSDQVQRMMTSAPGHRAWQYASVAFAVAGGVACGLAALLLRGGRPRAAVLGTLLAVEALAMFVVPELSAPRSATVDTGPVQFLQSHLGSQRFYTLGPLAPNYGSYWQVATVSIDDLPVRSYARYVKSSLDTNVEPNIFLGTTSADPKGPSPSQELLAHLTAYEASGVKYVLENHGSPPLVSAGKQLPVVYSDPVVDIVELPDPAPLMSTSGDSCSVVTSGRDQAVADCRTSGMLVRRVQYLPGWVATDSGSAVTVSRYRSVFQSVPVRAGRNVVRFSYSPPYIDLASAAAGAGVAALAAAALIRPRRRRRGERAAGEDRSAGGWDADRAPRPRI